MIGLVFPHQLFKKNPLIAQGITTVYIIEDSLFFADPHTGLKFHKQKIAFHRSSMKAYAEYLKSQGYDPIYVDYAPGKTIEDLLKALPDNEQILCVDPTDYLLERRLKRALGERITFLESPLFLNTREENKTWAENNKRYFMHSFYQYQRRKLGILVEPDGSPTGGQWSFDTENRKKIPLKDIPFTPSDPSPIENTFTAEALTYVRENFSQHPGTCDACYYPTTHSEAEAWFDDFLKERFSHFGIYEDAIVAGRARLYHSMISPLLNVGLLDPKEVITKSLSKAAEYGTPLASLEGFLRQIIGWREYIRMLYEHKGSYMRKLNHWDHKRKLVPGYWTGYTGIEPLDSSLKHIMTYAYAHHIERLMLHGNFMFLNEIDPHESYAWFMEMFIDSYDWVMVPNIYGMSQHSAGNLMTTKPYMSGSNYILKMSNHTKGAWSDIWDASYWGFIIKHKEILSKNPRMSLMTKALGKISTEKQHQYENIIKNYRSSHE
jgi:deoxyribodipyrimidine photolyase-related protein